MAKIIIFLLRKEVIILASSTFACAKFTWTKGALDELSQSKFTLSNKKKEVLGNREKK